MTVSALQATTEYKVWAQEKVFLEEAWATHVVAQFRFMTEALDYVDYAIKSGANPIVLTGPGGFFSVYPKERKV